MTITSINDLVNSLRQQATKVMHDQQLLSDLLEQVMKKVALLSGRLYDVKDRIQAMIRLMKARSKGDYVDISSKSAILIIIGLLYLLNPFDLISDFIPVIGLIDDITVIGYIINLVDDEIDKFTRWEAERAGFK